jgi:hypothetical protein
MDHEPSEAQPNYNDPKYDIFDDMTLGVMQRNREALEEQIPRNAEEIKNAKDLTFRCDVVTPMDARNRAQHGATAVVDLRTAARAALSQAGVNAAELPSNTCYIKDIAVESAFNSLPVDVELSCNQNDKILGSFCKSKVVGEDSQHSEHPAMYVVHSGSEMHSDAGRNVYAATDFVNSDSFCKYLQALQRDVEDSTTVINGGQCVEYVSPWANGSEHKEMGTGDWLVDVMFNNPSSFKHPVQAVRTPAPGSTSKYVCSLRTHADDWETLKDAVQTNVISPLRANVIDLKTDPQLHFTLNPIGLAAPSAAAPNSETPVTARRSGSDVWRNDAIKEHEGRAGLVLRATLKFV